MKVLSIGTDRNLFVSGSEVVRRQIDHAKKLSALHIIVFATKAHKLQTQQISDNVWIYPTNSLSRWLYPIDAYRLGRRINGIDLITAQDPFESGLAAWLLRRVLRSNIELQVHTDFLSPHFTRKDILNWMRVRLARFLLPRADKIRVVSRRIADSLVDRGLSTKDVIEIRPISVNVDKIKNTPVGIDLHKKYQQFRKIVLMASRLTKEKNIGLAIDAMEIALQQQPDIGLVIVGAGPEEWTLKQKVLNLKLERSITFEPWVARDMLISYLKTADLFLLTSWYEGYGLSLAEAQAAGCPIISTDVGVAPEIGAIITSYDPLALSQLILRQL